MLGHSRVLLGILWGLSCGSLAAPFLDGWIGRVTGFALLMGALSTCFQAMDSLLWVSLFLLLLVPSVMILKYQIRLLAIIYSIGLLAVLCLIVHDVMSGSNELAWGFWLFAVLNYLYFGILLKEFGHASESHAVS
jgi:hypothetical protein